MYDRDSMYSKATIVVGESETEVGQIIHLSRAMVKSVLERMVKGEITQNPQVTLDDLSEKITKIYDFLGSSYDLSYENFCIEV